MPNLIEGTFAQVNSKQRDKMLSGKAVGKSVNNGFTSGEHNNLSAQIANAWKWSAEIGQYEDRKGRDNVSFGRYVAAVKNGKEDCFALITTREIPEGKRIYSVELIKGKELRLYADPGNFSSSGSPVRSSKELQEKFDGVVAKEALTGAASRSEEIISRLSGPVKSEASASKKPQKRVDTRQREDGLQSPGNGERSGISKEECRRVAANLNARAANAAGVEVVGTFRELPQNIRQRFADNASALEGVYDPETGKVWLVAGNLESTARAAEVWCHEQIVHNGLRGMFNEQERKVMLNQLWLSLGGLGNSLIRQTAGNYGIDPRSDHNGRLVVMEETLASLAERRQAGLLTPQQESMWRKVVRAVLNAISKVIDRVTGRQIRIGMQEVDNLLTALGRYVMTGMPGQTGAIGEASASLASKKGETNSYGIPLERVTEIEGEFTREEAEQALQKLAGQDLPNLLEGVTAQINRNQREKITSGKAVGKSIDNGFTKGQHYNLASRIANAWKWAAEVGKFKDRAGRADVAFRDFVAAVRVAGEDQFVLLTTMETQDGLRIYSAELLNEKRLRLLMGSGTESSDGPLRSHDDIISILSGPVKSESASQALASLNPRTFFNLGMKKAVELADAPEIHHFFNEGDLTLTKRILALPHWIAKQFPKFAQIYERQLRRMDERQGALMRSLAQVPALFGKGRLKKEDMASLGKLVWEIEGKPLPFEKEGKVKKYLPDGKLENGRTRIAPNPDYYDAYADALAEMPYSKTVREAMLQIRKSLDEDLARAYNRMAGMSDASDDTITKLRDNIGHVYNYFPHHRYGKYFIQAKKDGKVVFRQHFDAISDKAAKAKARELQAAQLKNYPDAYWSDGMNSKLPDEVLGAPIDPEAMEQIIKAATSKIGDSEQAAKVKALVCEGVADVLKGRGWAEHAIGRKGVPGHEQEDLVRVLYDYKAGLNGWLTKMDAAHDFSKMLGEIDARQNPQLWDYASQYVKDMLRNSDRIDRITGNIKGVAFAWYLGANIKTAVVNSTQNIIVGVPRLEMDVTSGAAMWLKSSADCIVNMVTGSKGRGVTAAEQEMLRQLCEEKIITDAYMEEVRGHMQGFSGAKLWDKFTKIIGWPMSVVEKFNRASLALAAYRAAMAGKMKPEAMERYDIKGKPTQEQAIAFATEVVRDAHFVYGKGNAPEMMRSNLAGRMAGSAYTFRTYSHNMLNMWLWALKNQGKEGAKFTAKSLGGTIALGGLTAFPFYATVSTLCQLLSGDDDDWTEEIRKRLPDNNLLRDVVCYGAPALAGVNLGGSLQMETPFTQGMRKAEKVEDFLDMSLEGIIGIPWDLAKKALTTGVAVFDGRLYDAAEELAPTFLKNIMQAVELFLEGQHSKKGTPINTPGKTGARKLTGYEAVAKAAGFQPVSSTKSYAAYAAEQRRQAVRSEAIDEVVAKFMKTIRTGESRYQLEGMQLLRKWNERMEKEGKPEMMFNLKDVTTRVKRRQGKSKPSRKDAEKGKRLEAVWGV